MDLQVGVKIILQNKEGKFLVVQRNAEKYPETGPKWDIVGGRINKGISLIENLKREVMEESGLEIKGESKLLTAQDILKTDKHVVRLTYSGFADGELILSDEHTNFKWLTVDEIKKLEPLDSYTKEVFNKFSI